MKQSSITMGILLSLLALSAGADDGTWASEIELGAVVTTGNTDQQNFKLRAGITRDSEQFKHTAHVDGLRSSEDSVVTAQKYYMYYQADYKLEGDHSLFGRVAYEDDKFSGFDYQTDFTLGYSRLLMDRDNMNLRGSVGVGARRSELTTGATKSEFLTRLALNYEWQVSESSKFTQLLAAEIGAESTITRSESALQASVAGNLALKVALNIKNQSEVPVGQEKTDTETSVTLVYSF